MKVVALLLLLGTAFAGQASWRVTVVLNFENVDHRSEFQDWMKHFGKVYDSIEEEAHRLSIFIDNWRMINNANSGNNNYTLGVNKFADLTAEEFKYYVHGHAGSCFRRDLDTKPKTYYSPSLSGFNVPDSVDWTTVTPAVITPVKNQGQCGSCWAFSATGAIESRSAIATGKLYSLSEQQLMDCSRAEGNLACNGGLMDDAFEYVQKEGGLCTEDEYPYTAESGTCKSSSCGKEYDPISSYIDVTKDNSDDLKVAVAAGPVSVAVEADQSIWQFYTGGVMDGTCGDNLDHGVLAVGYGTDSGEEYWKVKNSWGTDWGENGYVRICRECNKNGREGECGILAGPPSYPLV